MASAQMNRAQQILAARKNAAKVARSKGVTPVNAPAKVEPATERRKVEALKPKKSTPVLYLEVDQEIEDDEPTPPVKKFKKVRGKDGVVRRVEVKPEPVAAAPDKGQARAAARALTVIQSPKGGALAIPHRDRTREMDSRDTLIPRLKISQAMSDVNTKDLVRQGNFYQSPSNKNLGKEIYVVMVDMRKSRSYFETGQGILCRSYDLIKGEGDPGILCEGTDEEIQMLAENERGCPLRLWGERDENGRSTSPICGLNYNYILLLLEPDDLSNGRTSQAIFTLRSTATKVARAINTMCMDNGTWTDSVLKISLMSTSNTKGTFFVPSVEYWGSAGGKTKIAAERIAERLVGASIRTSMEADSDN